MRREGLALNVISFRAAILACVKGCQWQRVAPLCDEARREGLPLNMISFSAAIAACVEGCQWQRVAPLLEEMRKEGLALNMISFSAAILVSWQCGLLGVRIGEAKHPGPRCANCTGAGEMRPARLSATAPCEFCEITAKRSAWKCGACGFLLCSECLDGLGETPPPFQEAIQVQQGVDQTGARADPAVMQEVEQTPEPMDVMRVEPSADF
eukprot:1426237-Karenia_brevis.AAC.1